MIGIAGSLTHDVGIVHHYGIDAVFSVLTRIVTLEEAFGALLTIFIGHPEMLLPLWR